MAKIIKFIGDCYASDESIPGLPVWDKSLYLLLEKYKKSDVILLSPALPTNGIRRIKELTYLSLFDPSKRQLTFSGTDRYPWMLNWKDMISMVEYNWLVERYLEQLDYIVATYLNIVLVPLAIKFQLSTLPLESAENETLYKTVTTKYKCINLDSITSDKSNFSDELFHLSATGKQLLSQSIEAIQ